MALKWGVPQRTPSDEIEKLVSENVRVYRGNGKSANINLLIHASTSFPYRVSGGWLSGGYFLSSRRRVLRTFLVRLLCFCSLFLAYTNSWVLGNFYVLLPLLKIL